MADYQNILLQRPERAIAILTVNRPNALNALNAATLDEIADAATFLSAMEPRADDKLLLAA